MCQCNVGMCECNVGVCMSRAYFWIDLPCIFLIVVICSGPDHKMCAYGCWLRAWALDIISLRNPASTAGFGSSRWRGLCLFAPLPPPCPYPTLPLSNGFVLFLLSAASGAAAWPRLHLAPVRGSLRELRVGRGRLAVRALQRILGHLRRQPCLDQYA